MARLLRLELAGGLYHVTSRGDRREAIYVDEGDRMAWLKILQSCVSGDYTLQAIANALGVHTATVSRAVMGR